MADVTKTRMTAKEFLSLPESNLPAELLMGEMVMPPAPELNHQDIVLQLGIFLRRAAPDGRTYISLVDVYLDEDNVVQPDVLWIAPAGACISVEGRHLRGAPDLVIEVLSPATALRDRREKFALYEKHGALEYWLVDPEAQYIEVWRFVDEAFQRQGAYSREESFESAVLGGKKIDLKAIFGG